MYRKHYRDVKKALTRAKCIDPFTYSRYKLTPYSACGHGCVYCDGRAERYYVEGDFQRDIVIRQNLPELLENELPKIREKGFLCIGSGVSDSYQPVEKDEKLMQRIAGLCLEHKQAAAILTKSSLILRDLDTWSKVHEKAGFMILVSLVFADDGQRKIFEPHASPVEERLHMLEAFKKAGCITGVLMMPLLPHILDAPENVKPLMERLRDIGVDFIMPGSLTLRPGKQKEFYLERIKKHFPHLLETYASIYRENRDSGSPHRDYLARFNQLAEKTIKPFGLADILPHRCYHGRIILPDEIHLLMQQMMTLYKRKGINTAPLKKAFYNYHRWLMGERTGFNRKRKLPADHLEQRLRQTCENGEFSTLISNPRLETFLLKVMNEGKCLNPVTLELA